MKTRSTGAGLLRVILIPLVCALFALSGVAASRANAARLADPDRLATIALCLPSGQPTDEAPHDHDCDACCLVVPVALTPPLPDPLDAPLLDRALRVSVWIVPPAGGSRMLPWSRGPPGAV